MHTDMGAEGATDDELMLRARAGDREAFRALVRRHQSRALSLATKYLGDSAPARDATQEAFVDLYFALPRYRPEGRFASYWHRLLLNRCRMATRAQRTRDTLHAQVAQLRPPSSSPPEDRLIACQTQRDVGRAMSRLSEKLREVIALRFGGGLALQEVADTLELPLGTVKSRLFAALAELRAAMKEDA